MGMKPAGCLAGRQCSWQLCSASLLLNDLPQAAKREGVENLILRRSGFSKGPPPAPFFRIIVFILLVKNFNFLF